VFVELEDGGGVAPLAFQALELEFAELVEGLLNLARQTLSVQA
jgi:hypothetical protein